MLLKSEIFENHVGFERYPMVRISITILINTKQQSKTATSMEYSIMFRIAEQYLIRAEARARQGELIGAKED